MELLLLDTNFQEISRVDDFHSLIWREKFYDVGSYELYLMSEDIETLKRAKYIYRNDIQKLCFINDIDYILNENGTIDLSVKGKFIESLLNDEVIEKERDFNGTHSNIAETLVRSYFPTLTVKSTNFGKNATLKLDGEEIGTALYDFLKAENLSYSISYDYLTNRLTFEVIKGLDRTYEQSINSIVLLSDENETIQNMNYTFSNREYKNYVIVTGDGEKTNPFTVFVDKSNGQARKKLRVKSSISRNKSSGMMSENEYRKALEQKGIEELEKHKLIESLHADLININYREDYLIGDMVSFKINALNLSAELVVSEVEEVIESGLHETRVKFGEDFATLTNLIRR